MSSFISALDPASLQGPAKGLLDAVQASLGVTPNLFRVVAHSPAALGGLLGLNGALAKGQLPARLREQIALAVAEINRCDYCLSAHSYLASRAGLSPAEIAAARDGQSTDPKANAAIHFAALVTKNRGQVGEDNLSQLRQAGFSDGEIVEIIAHTALNTFTNYINVALGTEIDFPVVHAAAAA